MASNVESSASEGEECFSEIKIDGVWKTYKLLSSVTIKSLMTALAHKGVNTKGKALVDENNVPVSVKSN